MKCDRDWEINWHQFEQPRPFEYSCELKPNFIEENVFKNKCHKT